MPSDQLQGERGPSAQSSGISRDLEGAGTVEQAVWRLPLLRHPEGTAESAARGSSGWQTQAVLPD